MHAQQTVAAATARAVVIPFGQRAPSTMLGANVHAVCIFVFLPFPNNIIFAKRGESTNEYKRSTKTQWETTSRAVQTNTNGAHTNTKEYKRSAKTQGN